MANRAPRRSVTADPVTLGRIVALLDGAGIPYMVTGSVASSHHGLPRMTHDADVVVDLEAGSLERLLKALQATDLYVGVDTARDALRARRQFNVIDPASGFKIDLIVLKDRPFSRVEFERRRPARLTQSLTATVASAEDSILSKLEWSRKAGESAQQLADAAGVVRMSAGALDVAYIERWAAELGVLDLWKRVALSPR
jgi:hypothetical protein